MNYLEVKFNYNPDQIQGDILLAEVAEIPFESFVEDTGLLIGYILASDFNAEELNGLEILAKHNIIPQVKEIEQVNWNEEWEKNFDPVIVSDKCVIKADFHKLDKEYPLSIRINPKMSFGTGHHATTSLMMEAMLPIDFSNTVVLDMGTGTGVLAILAVLLGSNRVEAIDNNIWAYENSIENVELNNCQNHIEVLEGEVDLIKGKSYDYILANINKNVIKDQLAEYTATLKTGGSIFVSGVLADDSKDVEVLADKCGLQLIEKKIKDKWSLMVFTK